MSDPSPDKQVLIDASKAADAAYEKLSDQIAAVLEAGETVTPELQAAHSTAMRSAIKARKSLEDAEADD
jgi:hypothetical protein